MQTENNSVSGTSSTSAEPAGVVSVPTPASSPQVSLAKADIAHILARARALLEAGERCVVLARSLPAAVFVRETLAPTRYLDEHGLPISARNAGVAAIYRARFSAPIRRALLDDFVQGRRQLLILTPEDLSADGTLDALRVLGPTRWLVQDAHCLCLESASFIPAYQGLFPAWQGGLIAALELFSPVIEASAGQSPVLEALCQSFGLNPASLQVPAVTEARAAMSVELVLEPSVLQDRTVLSAGLKHHLSQSGAQRGVVVAGSAGTSAGLPREELLSVASEVGARAVTDPGEDVTAETERHAELFHAGNSLLLTEDAEAIEVLPVGGAILCLRVAPPVALEQVWEEALQLQLRGGGAWVYLGDSPSSSMAQGSEVTGLARALAEWLLAQTGEGQTRLTFDLQSFVAHLKKTSSLLANASLEEAGRAVEASLGLLWGAGFLASVQRVRFLLEVVESHRVASPHIDHDPRYVSLRRKYDQALSKMGMMQAVRLQLNSRPAKDLRELSGLLDIPVSTLNTLFNDLAKEGLALCRQVISGTDPANRNYEVVLGSRVAGQEAEALASTLEGIFARILARMALLNASATALSTLMGKGPLSIEVLEGSLHYAREELGAGGTIQAVSPGIPVQTPGLTGRPETSGTTTPTQESRGESRAVSSGSQQGQRPRPVDGVRAPKEAPTDAHLQAFDTVVWGLAGLDEAGVELMSRALAGLYGQTARLQALGQQLAAAPESPMREIAQILVSQAAEDVATAVELLRPLTQQLSETDRATFLPLLLRGMDYRARVKEGEASTLPSTLTLPILLLPVLEGLSAERSVRLLQAAEMAVGLKTEELGVVELEQGDSRWLLHRQSVDPELEAALWLELEALGLTSIPEPLILARLTEAYLMVDGIAAPELTARLQARVLETSTQPAWMDAGRRALAVGRAAMHAGQPEAVLELLERLPESMRGGSELARLKAGALLAVQQPLDALEVLLAGSVLQRGEGQVLWAAVLKSLETLCEAQATCESCPLLGSSYCPASSFVEFLGANPLGESRKSLRFRLEKRGRHGLTLESPRQLSQLLEAFPGRWNAELLGHWLDTFQTSGATEQQLELVQHLLEAGHQPLAQAQLDRVMSRDDVTIAQVMSAVRLLLQRNMVAPALTLALRAESMGWRPVDAQALMRDLIGRYGQRWMPKAAPPPAPVEAEAVQAETSVEEVGATPAQELPTPEAVEAAPLPTTEGEAAVEATASEVVAAEIPVQAESAPASDNRSARAKKPAPSPFAELSDELRGLLARLAALKEQQSATQAVRDRLARELRGNAWRELRAALDAYRAAAPVEAAKEPLVRDAASKLADREKRIAQRAQQIVRESAGSAAALAELEQLISEAEALGAEELVSKAREGAERLKARAQERERQAAARAAEPKPASEPKRTSEPRAAGAPKVGGEPRKSVEAESGGAKRPSGDQPPRRNEGAARGEGQGAERRGKEAQAPSSRPPRTGAGEAPRADAGPVRLEGQALLDGLKAARGDRDRMRLLMNSLDPLWATDTDKAMKSLRDSVEFFERPHELDQALARLIREQGLATEHFPRLRRVLDKHHAGRNLTATYEEMTALEHPEPWKLVLGQLKLK